MAGIQQNKANLIADTVAAIFANVTKLIDASVHQQLLLDFMESLPNIITDTEYLGAFTYDAGRAYKSGAGVIYQGGIYVSNQLTVVGSFNPTHWDLLSRLPKSDTVAVTTAGTAIAFGAAFTLAYSLQIRCYDASGNNVDYKITAKTVNGFTITPSINSTMEYTATQNNE